VRRYEVRDGIRPVSHRRFFGRVESGGLLHRDVVVRLEEDFTIPEGTRVALFEVAEDAPRTTTPQEEFEQWYHHTWLPETERHCLKFESLAAPSSGIGRVCWTHWDQLRFKRQELGLSA
jgi:hypothetical protein